MADWFRKKTWTKVDEEHFFSKLARARKDGRAQYLKIQAIELIETRSELLLDVAEQLINKLLSDYPDCKFERASSFNALGDIYKLRNDFAKAIDYYKQALDFEQAYPQVQTNAYLNFSELIIKTKKAGHYPEVEKLLLERVPNNLFPIVQYKGYSILSIINTKKGNKQKATHFADLAEKYANQKMTDMRYHRYLGVVKERDSWLDGLVKKLRS